MKQAKDDSDEDENEAADDEEVESLSSHSFTSRSGSYSSSGSSDASLGQLLGDVKLPASFGGTTTQVMGNRRNNSMPNLRMQLEANVAPSDIENTEQRNALERFMDRMNIVSDKYFQAPPPNEEVEATLRRTNSAGAIDDLRKNTNSRENPANFFQEMVEKDLPRTKQEILFTDQYWEDYFLPITEKRRKAYTREVVDAVRREDTEALKRIIAVEGDSSMEAVNEQGETLLHHACRRRSHELIKFLVITAHVSVKTRDDYGKTPFHEICWYTEQRNPSQFHSIQFLMVLAPELFFAKDKRGYTPLQYAPKTCWKDWCRFLSRHKDTIKSKVGKMNF